MSSVHVQAAPGMRRFVQGLQRNMNFRLVEKGHVEKGSKRSYILKQTWSYWLQVCLSLYDLLLPPGIKRLKHFELFYYNQPIKVKYRIYLSAMFRGVFRTHSDTEMEIFCENS